MKLPHKKSWSGRFEKTSDPLLERFNASLSFDQRLFAEDIEGSLAHAEMLQKIGVLTESEWEEIFRGLSEIKKEFKLGKVVLDDTMEDIHMAIETLLVNKIGNVGKKLHTGRSRNDQVALDLRLYCRKKIWEILNQISSVQKALVSTAENNLNVVMPGYTHLQRAQPILAAHHLMAYFEMLTRDFERFTQTGKRLAVSPLGSGALAGSTFDLDREFVAKKLELNGVTHNSLDAVSDRDFVAEILFNNALLIAHLSRFAEELVLWCSQEFQFIKLPEDFCTGSSMMPQKINPDVPELIRGKTGRVYGHLISLLTVIKGLPLAYNKDLQEDKEALFDSVDTILDILEILERLVSGLSFNAEKTKKANEEGFVLATDLADYLVGKKIAFREAHEIVGTIIRYCLENKTTLENLPLKKLKEFSSQFSEDVKHWLNVYNSINRRKGIGGTAATCVKKEIQRAKKILGMKK